MKDNSTRTLMSYLWGKNFLISLLMFSRGQEGINMTFPDNNENMGILLKSTLCHMECVTIQHLLSCYTRQVGRREKNKSKAGNR